MNNPYDEFDELATEGDLRPIVSRTAFREETELDITPMIDITFLLLIFFLVASTPDTQFDAELPEARYGVGVGERDSVIFTVAQSGGAVGPVYLGDGKIAANQLPDNADEQRDRIEQEVRQGMARGRENVLIKADKDVAHREVARVSEAASRVPGIRLHFAVLETD